MYLQWQSTTEVVYLSHCCSHFATPQPGKGPLDMLKLLWPGPRHTGIPSPMARKWTVGLRQKCLLVYNSYTSIVRPPVDNSRFYTNQCDQLNQVWLFLFDLSGEMECSSDPNVFEGGDMPRCPENTWLVPILLGGYILITNVLMLNLLIAMFR